MGYQNMPTDPIQLNLPTDPMQINLPTEPIQLNLPTDPMQLNFTTDQIVFQSQVENKNPGTNSFQSSTEVSYQQNDKSGNPNDEFKIENDKKNFEIIELTRNCDNQNSLESAQLTSLKNPTELKKGAYKCFICKNLFGSLETLNHHNCLVNNSKDKVVNETVNKKGFKCTFCPKFCKSMEDLIQH